jgi:alkanesulfonate monooxygenase SsuD/methylene tetrahydromethanopterin reductase-like flavin-dependent oxidoreductase (luciferase family)
MLTEQVRPMLTVGIQTWGVALPRLKEYWAWGEELGYDRITYGDGLWPWTHDGWTMLGALAVLTRRCRIGPAVTYCFGRSARHPSWLAKAAVTVDHLSGGRLDLRLGVGSDDRAAALAWLAHGIDYPTARDRVDCLAEGIRVIKALCSGRAVDFGGEFFTLKGARLEPGPLQAALPVWVAAMGPGALRVAARWAEGWEASYLTPQAFAGKRAELETLVKREGRKPEAMHRSVEVDVVIGASDKTVGEARERFCQQRGIGTDHRLLETALIGTPDAVLQRIAQYEAAGATDLMCAFADFPDREMLTLFGGEVLPVLRR